MASDSGIRSGRPSTLPPMTTVARPRAYTAASSQPMPATIIAGRSHAAHADASPLSRGSNIVSQRITTHGAMVPRKISPT